MIASDPIDPFLLLVCGTVYNLFFNLMMVIAIEIQDKRVLHLYYSLLG